MTSIATPLCEMTGISKSYGAGGIAVRDISLAVAPGELVLLVGPSGSGKTTLLTLMAGLLRPDAGTVRLFGADVTRSTPSAMQRLRSRRIGFVFQTFHLLDALTAVENVALALRFGGVRESDAIRRARTLLAERGIGHLAGKKPSAMSQGEKQRVAITRAVANQPDLILADEPTASLESAQGAAIIALLREYAAGTRSVVVATHDLRMCDHATRVLRIEDGRIVTGSPANAAPLVAPPAPGPAPTVRLASRADNEALFALVDSRPITTAFAYVTDRRPDFFGLHRMYPESRVVVGESPVGTPDHGSRPALESCCSCMAYEGRLGDRIGRFDHYTDLCRRADRRVPGLLREMLNTAARQSMEQGALAVTALVNQGNPPPLGILRNPDTLLPATHAATFRLTEVVPLGSYPAPSLHGARAVENDSELGGALDLINETHAGHQLFRPLDREYLARLEAALPGFSRENLWIIPGRERPEAAAIWFDPTPLYNVRVTRYSAMASGLAAVIRGIHATTGALYAPPGVGEAVRSLHVQAMAHRSAEAGRALLRGISNLTRERRMHTYAFMVDERASWPVPNRVRITYKSLLFVLPIAGRITDAPDQLAARPWYFNLTLG